jgi:hypothetical protein
MSRTIIKSFASAPMRKRIVMNANFNSDEEMVGYTIRILTNFQVNGIPEDDYEEACEEFPVDPSVRFGEIYSKASDRFRELVQPLI